MATMTRTLQPEPEINPHTVYAHPNQELPEGEAAGSYYAWGDEWRIGRRHGRWLVIVSKWPSLPTELVRVEWDRKQSADNSSWGRWAFVWNAEHESKGKHQTAVEADVTRAMGVAREFDTMAVELWERRER